MAFDGFFTHAVVHELDQTLATGRVAKVNQPYPAELIMTIRAHRHNYSLLLSANPTYPRMQITQIAVFHYCRHKSRDLDFQTALKKCDKSLVNQNLLEVRVLVLEQIGVPIPDNVLEVV